MAGEIDISLDLNHTELVQLAQFNDIPGASSVAPREELIEAINEMKPISCPNPIDGCRTHLSEWLKKWWETKFRSQADHKECPNCFLCTDVRALDCYNVNKDEIK